MTEPRLVLLLAWKIAEILSKSRPGDDCTPFAQDVILEVAAWLRKRNVRVRASVEIAGDLEREINQAQPEPTLTVQDCNDMPKHGENFIAEDRPGEIILDGLFTREDLIEIANTVPPTKDD